MLNFLFLKRYALFIRFTKRSASLSVKIGVSLIGLAIIVHLLINNNNAKVCSFSGLTKRQDMKTKQISGTLTFVFLRFSLHFLLIGRSILTKNTNKIPIITD